MGQRLVTSLPSTNEFLAAAIKNYEKADMKVLCSCPILPGCRLSARQFCQDFILILSDNFICFSRNIFFFITAPMSASNFSALTFFIFHFSIVCQAFNAHMKHTSCRKILNLTDFCKHFLACFVLVKNN